MLLQKLPQKHHTRLHVYTTYHVKFITGNDIKCRTLIDNVYQNSLFSKNCVEWLNLPVFSTNHMLVGVNGISAETCQHFKKFNFSDIFQVITIL